MSVKGMKSLLSRAIVSAFILLSLLSGSFLVYAESDNPPVSYTSITTDANSKSSTMSNAETASKSEGFLGLSYSDIINTALGAFLGFFASLLVENRLKNRRRRKCIDNIALELKDLRDRIKQKKEDRDMPSALSYELYTPIWETVIGNGDILELKNKPYYENLFKIYNSLAKLSRLEDGTREGTSQDVDKIIEYRAAVLTCFEEEPIMSLIPKIR